MSVLASEKRRLFQAMGDVVVVQLITHAIHKGVVPYDIVQSISALAEISSFTISDMPGKDGIISVAWPKRLRITAYLSEQQYTLVLRHRLWIEYLGLPRHSRATARRPCACVGKIRENFNGRGYCEVNIIWTNVPFLASNPKGGIALL